MRAYVIKGCDGGGGGGGRTIFGDRLFAVGYAPSTRAASINQRPLRVVVCRRGGGVERVIVALYLTRGAPLPPPMTTTRRNESPGRGYLRVTDVFTHGIVPTGVYGPHLCIRTFWHVSHRTRDTTPRADSARFARATLPLFHVSGVFARKTLRETQTQSRTVFVKNGNVDRCNSKLSVFFLDIQLYAHVHIAKWW